MRTVPASFVCVAALTLAASPAPAQTAQLLESLPDLRQYSGGIAKMLEAAPLMQMTPGPFRTGLVVPATDARPQIRRTVKDMLKNVRKDPEMVQLLKQAPASKVDALYAAMTTEFEVQLFQGLDWSEARLDALGLARHDMGAALGFMAVSAYETANRRTLPSGAVQKASRALAVATTKYFKPKFAPKTAANKAELYVVLLGVTSMLTTRGEQGDTEEAAHARRLSAYVFEKLTGTAPSKVTIQPDGRITGLASRPPWAKSKQRS